MLIILIGSGNVATVLAKMFTKAGHEIQQVFSRTLAHAKLLADEMGAEYTSDPADIEKNADLYLIAVADSSLVDIRNWLKLEQQLVVHTAGSISLDVLNKVSTNTGILYPLQSLHKQLDHFPEIPFLVDGNNALSKKRVQDLAGSISSFVEEADDALRMKMHIAAIFTNNFVNYLYKLSESYCSRNNVGFEMLYPLIRETAERIGQYSPSKIQTGPAARKDLITIQKHQTLLRSDPMMAKWYQLFTDAILKDS